MTVSIYKFSTLILFVSTFFVGCNQKQAVRDDYSLINEAASKLTDASVYVIDTDSSYVSWTINKNEGPALTGSFHPAKGSLVLEKGVIVAGFLEGDLWDNNKADPNNSIDFAKEKKAILDSFPRLQTKDGRNLRFDITQSGRSVLRSDFRLYTGLPEDSIPGYSFQVNMVLADSLLAVVLPFKQSASKSRFKLDCSHVINVQEFGVLSNPKNPSALSKWSPNIPLKFHLVFKKYK
jgi:hypothetical protein